MLEQGRRTIADEKIHHRVGEGASKIRKQRRREHDVPQATELRDENAAGSRDARRFHSAGAPWAGRHSFAYCMKA